MNPDWWDDTVIHEEAIVSTNHNYFSLSVLNLFCLEISIANTYLSISIITILLYYIVYVVNFILEASTCVRAVTQNMLDKYWKS